MPTTTITLTNIIESGHALAKNDPFVMTQAAYDAIPDGACFGRQGDIYFFKCREVPSDAIPVKPYKQLAPGETLGSRHCLVSLRGVEMFQRLRPTALDGPILRLHERNTVTNPTHGDIVGLPAGAVFQVKYQRMYADELRRVTD